MLQPAQTVAVFHRNQKELLSFRQGEVIFSEGEIGQLMYGVLEGEVELTKEGKVLETICSGDIFGEGALVQPEKTRATTAIAKVDCKLACLDQQHFLFAVQNTPMFAIEVMRSLSGRLRRLKSLYAEID